LTDISSFKLNPYEFMIDLKNNSCIIYLEIYEQYHMHSHEAFTNGNGKKKK